MQIMRLPKPVGDMVAASIYNHFILLIKFLAVVGDIKINSYPASHHLISLKPSNGFQNLFCSVTTTTNIQTREFTA